MTMFLTSELTSQDPAVEFVIWAEGRTDAQQLGGSVALERGGRYL